MIKLFALITMVIDHIGLVFFPNVIIFRIIGRLSMPLFAYCVARGYFYSKQKGSVSKYVKNLSIFAAISQLSYGLLFDGTNIGATWLISVLILIILDVSKKKVHYVLSIIAIVGILILLQKFLNVDYGIYGIITPIIMYKFFINEEKIWIGAVILLLLIIFYILVEDAMKIQIFSLFAIIIICVSKKKDNKIKLPKTLYYVFYPLHLLVFKLITLL